MRDAGLVFAAKAALYAALLLSVRAATAQGNHEIQVYGADAVPPKTLMTELHSNYTIQGQKYYVDGVIPTNRQEPETLELTVNLTFAKRFLSDHQGGDRSIRPHRPHLIAA